MRVSIHATPDDVARAASDLVAAELATLGRSTLALAGGSTPRATHARLIDAAIDWSLVTMWLADERWVPADDEESNARMARETLVDQIGGTLVAPHYGDDPEASAAAYSDVMAELWVERDGAAAPDVVMLGMGPDGHTASLFPGSSALDAPGAGYVATWLSDKKIWRLTATFGLLWSARTTVFLVTGEGKADMVRRIVDAGEPFPAQRVAAGSRGDVVWMLDEGAASQLKRPR